ncbi:hypothetical protein RCS94_07025 [Orbaceae bacterium ac157xtp]
MIKKYLKISKLIFFVVALFGGLPLTSYADEGKITLKTLDVYSPFKHDTAEDDDEDEDKYIEDDGGFKGFSDDFADSISSVHPPVLVEYDNQYSLLLFISTPWPSHDARELIYNINLGNHKINEVGKVGKGEIISIFGYDSPDGPLVLILTKDDSYGMTRYVTTRISVKKEEGGLYIQSTAPDRVMLLGLDDCINEGCKYRDADSVKKFLDNMYKTKK